MEKKNWQQYEKVDCKLSLWLENRDLKDKTIKRTENRVKNNMSTKGNLELVEILSQNKMTVNTTVKKSDKVIWSKNMNSVKCKRTESLQIIKKQTTICKTNKTTTQ